MTSTCMPYLATAAADIKLWTVDLLTVNHQFSPHRGVITSLSLSPNGNIMASACKAGDDILLTYINAGYHCVPLSGSANMYCATFNSDARYVAGAGMDGIVRVWDVQSRQVRRTFDKPAHKVAVTSLAFSLRDKAIASGSVDGKLILYNTVTGQGCSPLQTSSHQAINQLRFSHFRQNLLAGACDDCALCTWDSGTKSQLCRFEMASGGHSAPCTGLVFSPCNQMLLASVGLDKNIICYDVIANKVIKTMASSDPLTCVDLLPDGSTLIVGTSHGCVSIYDLRKTSYAVRSQTAHPSAISQLCFSSKSPNGPKPAKQSTSRDVSFTSNSVAVNSINITPSTSNAVSVTSSASDSDSASVPVSSTPCHVTSTSSKTGALDLFSPLQESVESTESDSPMSVQLTSQTRAKADDINFAGAEMSVFSPLSDEDVVKDAAVNGDDARLSLTTQLLPQSSSRNMSTSVSTVADKDSPSVVNGHDSRCQSAVSAETVCRPSRVCFDLPSHASSPAAAAYKPASPAAWESRTRPVTSSAPAAPAAGGGSSSVTPTDAQPSSVQQQPAVPSLINCGDGMVPPDGVVAAAGDASSVVPPYLVELMQTTVRDEVEEVAERLHGDVIRMHVDMLVHVDSLRQQVEVLTSQLLGIPDLLAEIERLRAENEQLRRYY